MQKSSKLDTGAVYLADFSVAIPSVMRFFASALIFSVPFFAFDYRPMTSLQTLILLAAGVSAAVGQFGVTAAYRFAEPREIAVFDYTNIVFTGLLGFMFFAQKPDMLSVAGFVVILLAAMRMRCAKSNVQKAKGEVS